MGLRVLGQPQDGHGDEIGYLYSAFRVAVSLTFGPSGIPENLAFRPKLLQSLGSPES